MKSMFVSALHMLLFALLGAVWYCLLTSSQTMEAYQWVVMTVFTLTYWVSASYLLKRSGL
jgi:hypothetical protein